jgi:hypothetical protein
MAIEKCCNLTYISWRRVFQKEQIEKVGRPEVEGTNTEFEEMKEMHVCKKQEKRSLRQLY